MNNYSPEEQKLYDETIAWLQTDPAIQQELQQYRQNTIESFIEGYAKHKVYLVQLKAACKNNIEENEQEWLDNANECLQHIQQKKLFDLQCKWRAELITIPEITISAEFEYWEDNIMNCPFLTPISKQELECYKRYLSTQDYENDSFDDWQNYEDIKEFYLSQKPDTFNAMPDWYEFHNGETGNGTLLLLPNLRGEKEAFYRQVSFDEANKKLSEEELAFRNQPMLIPMDEDFRKIAEPFDKAMLDLLNKENEYEEMAGNGRRDNGEDIMYSLFEIGPWPINASHDWLLALKKCYASYQSHMLLQFIDTAYAQYKMQLKMGFGFSGGTSLEMSYIPDIKEQILEGRAILGEPQDFNF
jgi:hypothetical protein